MKRTVIFTLMAICALLVVGCGGGGGGGGSISGGQVTSYFHVQNQSNTPLVGVVVNYTEPDGTVVNSPASNSSGDATVISRKVGTYTVNYATYNGNIYRFTPAVTFVDSASDISSNLTTSYRIDVNTVTGVIQITRLY